MRKALTLLLLFSSLFLKAQTSYSFHNAIEYNDYIVGKQTLIGTYINDINIVVSDSLSTVDDARTTLRSAIAKTKVIIDDVRNMPDWNGNTELRESAVALFNFYLSCFENEYASMIELVYKEDLSETEAEQLDALMAQVTEKEKGFDDRFAKAQENFAKANNFTLAPAEGE